MRTTNIDLLYASHCAKELRAVFNLIIKSPYKVEISIILV